MKLCRPPCLPSDAFCFQCMSLRKAEPPHFKPYDFRHTYASLLHSEGEPLVHVYQRLGHAKPTPTLNHYAKWMPSGIEPTAR